MPASASLPAFELCILHLLTNLLLAAGIHHLSDLYAVFKGEATALAADSDSDYETAVMWPGEVSSHPLDQQTDGDMVGGNDFYLVTNITYDPQKLPQKQII